VTVVVRLKMEAILRHGAQWLFTVGIAATIAIAGAFGAGRATGARAWLFIVSLVVLGYGLAGAVSIMAGKANFRNIDAAVLSHKPLPIERYLADAYSRMLRKGENTISTRITIFRQAVLRVIVGGYLGLIAVLTQGRLRGSSSARAALAACSLARIGPSPLPRAGWERSRLRSPGRVGLRRIKAGARALRVSDLL
jgi:hypothetical protein